MRGSNVSKVRMLRSRPATWLGLFTFVLAGISCGSPAAVSSERVEKITLLRVPDGGLQPQASFDAKGSLHLVYYRGEAAKGDLYYVRSSDGGKTFSEPLRVNSQLGSAVAAGTIRGAQLALGEGGRVHMAWNGSSVAEPKGPLNPEQPADSPHNGLPMLYARLDNEGKAFEPQRNLMRKTFALDGGGTIAADGNGHIYVLWHGSTAGDGKGEGGRRVWISRSEDDGASFAPEEVAYTEPTGACGCCGMRAFVDSRGDLYALFRSARQEIHRDVYLLHSRDQGRSFEGRMLDPWEINACPMTSFAFVESSTNILAAWETGNKVYFAQIGAAKPAEPVLAPGAGDDNKHPSLAVNSAGETLLVWMEGEGWGKGGTLRWQLYSLQGDAVESPGQQPGIPPFSFGAALARPDGGFTILY
jgi:hypothetical protein